MRAARVDIPRPAEGEKNAMTNLPVSRMEQMAVGQGDVAALDLAAELGGPEPVQE